MEQLEYKIKKEKDGTYSVYMNGSCISYMYKSVNDATFFCRGCEYKDQLNGLPFAYGVGVNPYYDEAGKETE